MISTLSAGSAQMQLFRTPSRVAELLRCFLREVGEWIHRLALKKNAKDQWPKNAPIFIYPVGEVGAYIETSYGSMTLPGDPEKIAHSIYSSVARVLNEDSDIDPPIRHKDVLRKLFQISEAPAPKARDGSNDTHSNS